MPLILTRPQNLSFGETIGSLLTAIVDAQAQSARATVEFINDVGFLPPQNNQPETLRTVRFTYSKLDENNQRGEFSVEIPLLAMVDIPLVTVKKATIQFKYEVTANAPAVQPLPARPGFAGIPKAQRIGGRVSDVRAGSTERANLEVSIELEKGLLPVGLDKILDILELAVATKPRPAPA